jgi:hypothetical protein
MVVRNSFFKVSLITLSFFTKLKLSCFVLIFCSVTAFTAELKAQDRFQKISVSGKEEKITIQLSDLKKGSLSFLAESKGIVSGSIASVISAPQNTKIDFSATNDPGSNPATTIERKWWRVLVSNVDGGRRSEHTIIPAKSSQKSVQRALIQTTQRESTAPLTLRATLNVNSICSSITNAQITQIAAMLSQQYPQNEWTRETICNYIISGEINGTKVTSGLQDAATQIPSASQSTNTVSQNAANIFSDNNQIASDTSGIGVSSQNNSISNQPSSQNIQIETSEITGFGVLKTYGVLQKDACNSRKNRYFVRIRLNFSNVDTSALTDPVTISVKFLYEDHKGSKAATIKPVSDGKYAPKPLLLMSSVQSYNENVSMIEWRNGRPVSRLLKVNDYVFYRGLSLTRTVIDAILRGGGRRTFELTNGYNAYGVCFSLVRRRQNVNGYPNNG